MWPSQGLSLRLSMRVVSVVSGEWPGDSRRCEGRSNFTTKKNCHGRDRLGPGLPLHFFLVLFLTTTETASLQVHSYSRRRNGVWLPISARRISHTTARRPRPAPDACRFSGWKAGSWCSGPACSHTGPFPSCQEGPNHPAWWDLLVC